MGETWVDQQRERGNERRRKRKEIGMVPAKFSAVVALRCACVCVQWMKRVDDVGGDDGDGSSVISFAGERYAVVPTGAGGDAAAAAPRRLDSATVARKDGTYVSKLTVRRVADSDAGVYVCLCTNRAGYSLRRVQLAVSPPRESAICYQNNAELSMGPFCVT